MNFIKSTALAMTVVAGFSFASCSDDDNTAVAGTENVFTAGVPTSFDGAAITVNEKGQVTKIADAYDEVTFEYGTFTPSRATSYSVRMKYDNSYIYMHLNKMGFVDHALQVYGTNSREDSDVKADDTWDFEYNGDGQLSKMKRSEGSKEFKVFYENGDIKTVEEYRKGNKEVYRTYTVSYTNSENSEKVANKGCVMLFDSFSGVDVDEMKYAYFAGLLGKATKNLPMGKTSVDNDGTDSDVFHWELNSSNLPLKFWENNNTWDVITFNWK